MNTTKLSNLLLSALVLVSAGFFVAGCSSDDDTVPLPPDDGTPDDGVPDVAPPPPAGTINGLWEGTFSRETQAVSINYETSLLFNRIVSDNTADRGDAGGVAFGEGPEILDDPQHFLFAGGFTFFDVTVENFTAEDDTTALTGAETIICEVPNPDYPSTDGGVWAVGRFGTKGTFIQEFAYDTGSAAGENQRGAGCLYYALDADTNVAKLTGEIQFEDAGKLVVDLTYSPENARAVAIDSLALSGEDGSLEAKYHLWSNNNSGSSMSYTRATDSTTILSVVENSDVSDNCGGDVNVLQVGAQNLFTSTTTVTADCNVDLGGFRVDLPFVGLGAVADADGDGVPEYIQLMRSTGSGAGITAHALFNVFTINFGDGEF